FFFSSRRRHTRFKCDWSSDVCSSDLRERVEVLDGVGIFPWRKFVDCGEEEAVGTRGEILEGGGRVGSLVGHVLADRDERLFRRMHEAIRRTELLSIPACPAKTQCAGE